MKALLYGLFGLFALANTACSSGVAVDGFEKSSSSFSSRPGDTSTNDIAICNKVTNSGFNGTAQLFQTTNGTFANEMIRLQLNQLPGLLNTEGDTLQFFRWLANGSGLHQDQNSVQFYIELRDTRQPISGVLNQLTPADIVFFSRQGFSQTLDAKTFLSRVNLVLTDLSLEWDALNVRYTSKTGSTVSTNFLIPGFMADPNTYAAEHPAVLAQHHPNQAFASSGRSSTDFLQMTNTYCSF